MHILGGSKLQSKAQTLFVRFVVDCCELRIHNNRRKIDTSKVWG